MKLVSQKAILQKSQKANSEIKIYTIQTQKPIPFKPGQFFFLGVLGFGEAPFAPASFPKNEKDKILTFAIRKVGTVTSALDQLNQGENIWLRGPFGNGFPINRIIHDNIILVAGGTGIVIISGFLEYLIFSKQKYQQIFLLYGAKTPSELLFSEKFPTWRQKFKLFLAAEKAPSAWPEHQGMVTDLCKKFTTTPEKTSAIICGPPPMFGPVIEQIKKCHKIPDNKIYVSLESRMKCGYGKCQHCTFGEKYVCLDGPIFSWDKVRSEFEQ